jgi:hypothetical protein
MATASQAPSEAKVHTHVTTEQTPELILYGHSSLFYWWPVWVVGYVMALLTWLQGEVIAIGDRTYLMHPSKNLGVLYTVIIMLVIMFTNVSLRGLFSVLTIVSIMFVTVLFAWLDWWDDILNLLPYLGIHMNLGFYLMLSTVLLIVWSLAFFVFDRFTYWRLRPGQLTYERVIGGGERSYDTRGLVFEKRLEDLFRHHILGLGMGDLYIMTAGAHGEAIHIPNVTFVDRKVQAIQKLIAVKPVETTDVVVKAGEPG